jgi:hypothetical protein
MIASPGDVIEERKIVTEAIHEWNYTNAATRRIILQPVKWETHSTPQLRSNLSSGQDVINELMLDDADLLIGIFGTRIGTPTPEHVSGTVEEIRKHVISRKTAKVYFSDVPVSPRGIDAAQYQLVEEFRKECADYGLYGTFNNLDEFALKFRRDLAIELNHAQYQWLRQEIDVRNELGSLSLDATDLLRSIAATDDGMTILQSDMSGSGLRVGDREFIDGTARSEARWRAALKNLSEARAIEEISENVYRITNLGFQIADKNVSGPVGKQTAFDQHRSAQIDNTLKSMGDVPRDFLRFLLLHGGTVRSNVAHHGKNLESIDFNGLYSRLTNDGYITKDEDHITGYSTIRINEALTPILKEKLFPREESTNIPAFRGI